MRCLNSGLAALLLLSLTAGNAFGVYYTVTDLGDVVGGAGNAALDINNRGEVVGYSYDFAGGRSAFLYSNGQATDLGTLGGNATARGINNGGQIVGCSYNGNAYRAFLYSGGSMTSLGTLPGDYDSHASGINSSGQVAGFSRDFSYISHAFLYSGGSMTSLGTLPGLAESRAYAVNDSGQVVGMSYNFRDSAHAFLYSGGTMTDLGTLGGPASYATSINNAGQVVGAACNGNYIRRAFLYQNGAMADLGAVGGWTSYARDINQTGQVVGTAETAIPGVYHGFVYSGGTMTDLKSTVDPASRWDLRYATGINDSGAIVGTGRNPSGQWHGFLMTPITRTYASLSLPANGPEVRAMRGSVAASGGASVAISAAGSATTAFSLSSAQLIVTPTAGSVGPAVVQSVPVAMRWSDTADVGARSGMVSLVNASDPADPGNHTMSVSGAVLANRVLAAATIGSPSTPTRILGRAAVTTTLASGSDPLVHGDDVATRVNTVANARANNGVATVTYSASQPGGSLRSTFDGPSETANLAVSFSQKGPLSGSISLPALSYTNGRSNRGFLSDGEQQSVGAEVQPVSLSYNVEVLEPRRLRVTASTINLGDVLRGAAISSGFGVVSTNSNPSSQYTTKVTVASGGTPLGALTVGQATVQAGGTVTAPLTGSLTTYGSLRVRGSLPVVTAEEAAVQDTTAYRSLTVQYRANVGIAKFGRTRTSFGTGETVLRASVAPGATLANLSSKVNPAGTLAANPTLASQVTGLASMPGTAIYRAVGSEAEILDSTPLDDAAVVTMQWRQRLPGEAHDPRAPQSPSLPNGAWLTSDVVKIDGIADSVVYALQMTFDNRINLAFHGPVNGTVEHEFDGLYLAEFDTTANQWLNAGSGVGNSDSLADFLSDHAGTPLSDLLGNWGVDPLTSATGIGHSWAIVAGSGIFAVDPAGMSGGLTVVPEPSTLMLLISAAMGLAAFFLARRR